MKTKKQKQATWRNWFIMKTVGIITELYRIHKFCSDSSVREESIHAINAIKDLQKAIKNSKTEDWDG